MHRSTLKNICPQQLRVIDGARFLQLLVVNNVQICLKDYIVSCKPVEKVVGHLAVEKSTF